MIVYKLIINRRSYFYKTISIKRKIIVSIKRRIVIKIIRTITSKSKMKSFGITVPTLNPPSVPTLIESLSAILNAFDIWDLTIENSLKSLLRSDDATYNLKSPSKRNPLVGKNLLSMVSIF